MSEPIDMREVYKAAGSAEELGRQLGISGVAVRKWRRVPAERVIQVERLTGISRQAMRPDLYPAE